MLNEDDSLAVEDDLPDTEDLVEEISAEPAARPPRRARSKPPAKPAKKAAKPAAKKTATSKGRPAKTGSSASAPEGFTRVKAGSHSVWMTRELARALSAKDKRKLKALFKKAARRKKST